MRYQFLKTSARKINDSVALNEAKDIIGNNMPAQSIRTRRIEDSGDQAPKSKEILLI